MKDDGLRFEALFRHSPIPMYLWTRKEGTSDLQLADYNDAAVQLTEGKIATLRGRSASELYSAEPGILHDMNHCLETAVPIFRKMRYRMRSRDVEGSFRAAYIPASLTSVVVAVMPD